MQKLTLFTVRKAAELTGIQESLLHAAVRNGRIRSVILSKRRLIPSGALERFVAEVTRVTLGQETNEAA